MSPSEPVATGHADDQHRSRGGQSRAIAPGNAVAAYAGTAFRHSAASSSVSQRKASAATVSLTATCRARAGRLPNRRQRPLSLRRETSVGGCAGRAPRTSRRWSAEGFRSALAGAPAAHAPAPGICRRAAAARSSAGMCAARSRVRTQRRGNATGLRAVDHPLGAQRSPGRGSVRVACRSTGGPEVLTRVQPFRRRCRAPPTHGPGRVRTAR